MISQLLLMLDSGRIICQYYPKSDFSGFTESEQNASWNKAFFPFFAKFYEVLLCETLKIHQVRIIKICANFKDNLLKIELSIPFSKNHFSKAHFQNLKPDTRFSGTRSPLFMLLLLLLLQLTMISNVQSLRSSIIFFDHLKKLQQQHSVAS